MAERNRLRRTTDTVQSTIGTVLGVLAVLAAIAAVSIGVTVHRDVDEQAHRDAAATTPVTAELLESTTMVVNPSGAATRPQAYAAVRWTAPDGTPQQGDAAVPGGFTAGAAVTIWIDEQGRPTHAPLTASDAVLCGIVAGLAAAGVAGSLLILCWWLTRRTALAVNGRRWADEWAAVEPQWRRELR